MELKLNKKEIKLILESLMHYQDLIDHQMRPLYSYDFVGDLVCKIEKQCGDKYLGY